MTKVINEISWNLNSSTATFKTALQGATDTAVRAEVRITKALKAFEAPARAQQSMATLQEAVKRLGGVSRLTGPQLDILRRKLETLRMAGAKVPPVFNQVASSTQKMGTATRGAAMGAQAAVMPLTTSLGPLGYGLSAIGPAGLVAAVGIGATTLAIGSAIKAQDKQIESVNKLNLALANQGNYSAETSQRLQEQASALQKVTTFGDEVTIGMQAQLASYGMQEEALKRASKATLDFAAFTGKDLVMSADLVGKAFVGETGSLSRYGIIIDKNIPKSEKFNEVMKQLEQRYGGAAATEAATFHGQITQMGNAFGDTQEAAGKLLGELNKMGPGLGGVTSIFEWLTELLGVKMVIAIGEARAQFALLISSAYAAAHGIASAIDSPKIMGAIKKLPGMSLIEKMPGYDISEDVKHYDYMAKSFREYAETIREESDRAAVSVGKLRKVVNAPLGRTTPSGVTGGIPGKTLPALPDMPGLTKRDARKAIDAYIPDNVRERAGAIVDALIPIEDRMRKTAVHTERTKSAMSELASVTSGFKNLLDLVGVSADSTFGKIIGGAAGAVSAIGSAQAAFGKDAEGKTGSTAEKALAGMGLAGAAIGLGASIVGGLKKEGWEKALDEVGRDYGTTISEALAKEIEETDKRIEGGRFEASLLHLGDIMAEAFETGASAEQFRTGITDLYNAIEMGAVPAGEGLQSLGDIWGQLGEQAEAGSFAAKQAMVDMMSQAEETGNITASMAASMAAGVDKMTASMDLIIGGLQEPGQVQGQMFADTFWSAMGQEGPRAAADALKGSWETLRESGVEVGGEVGRLMMLSLENEAYRGASDVGQGLAQRMLGAQEAHMVTAGGFAAAGLTAQQAVSQALGGGATQAEAIAAVLPYLAQARETAALYGMELDSNTASLITQAETAGYAFPTEPMTQMVDLMREIVRVLGGEIPESAMASQSTTTAAFDQMGASVTASFGGSLSGASYRLQELGMSASSAASSIATEMSATGQAVDVTANMVVDGLDYARMGIAIMSGTSQTALGGVISSAQSLAGELMGIAGAAGVAGSAVGSIPDVGGGPEPPPGYASGLPGSPRYMPTGGLLRYHAREHVGVWPAGELPRNVRLISAQTGLREEQLTSGVERLPQSTSGGGGVPQSTTGGTPEEPGGTSPVQEIQQQVAETAVALREMGRQMAALAARQPTVVQMTINPTFQPDPLRDFESEERMNRHVMDLFVRAAEEQRHDLVRALKGLNLG